MKRASISILAAIAGSALLSACATPTAFDLADEAQLRADIAWLAAPERHGREPGGPAEKAIHAYAIDRMRQIGLAPAFPAADGKRQWLQDVVMTYRTPIGANTVFHRRGKTLSFSADQWIVVGETAASSRDDMPILFLGDATPAQIEGLSLSGNLVMMMQPPSSKEQGARIDALRAAGAIGAITVVEDRKDFRRISDNMLEPGFFLQGGAPLPETPAPREFFTAIISEQAAVQLADFSGSDWDRMRRDARAQDFSGSMLGTSADIDWQATIDERKTANIAGLLPGRKPGSGALLFMGHWDHLGLCGHGDTDAAKICPGAVDNASGVAAIWQIADHLRQHRHDRDIYFLLTTGEEEGFIGAHRFIASPPAALSDFTAIFNLDMLAIGSGTTDVAVIGWQGGNAVDTAIDEVLASLGLNRVETGNFKNYLTRQDGWVFLQHGLPARMVNSSFANDRLLGSFVSGAYHAPSDRYSADMDLGSAAQDIAIHVALGELFSDIEAFPAE